MSISHYTHTTQFLSDVTSTALDQLRGHDAAALTELQSLLATLKIRVSHEGTELTSAQMNKVLAFLLPPDAKLANGGYASQLQNGLNGVKKTLTEYANAHPHTDPGSGYSNRYSWRRPQGLCPDGYRQNGGLQPAATSTAATACQ